MDGRSLGGAGRARVRANGRAGATLSVGECATCVTRWVESMEAGVACPIDLEATHISTLEFVSLDDLQRHSVGGPTA